MIPAPEISSINCSTGVVIFKSKGEESCRSPSLWHTFLNLRRPETVTHNLRDLSAGCSGFEDKLISPHLLSTSALRFLHSNLPFRLCDCLHDYSGDATWTQATDKATESFLASAPLNMWAREGGNGQLSRREKVRSHRWYSASPSSEGAQTLGRQQIVSVWLVIIAKRGFHSSFDYINPSWESNPFWRGEHVKSVNTWLSRKYKWLPFKGPPCSAGSIKTQVGMRGWVYLFLEGFLECSSLAYWTDSSFRLLKKSELQFHGLVSCGHVFGFSFSFFFFFLCCGGFSFSATHHVNNELHR